MGSDPRIKGLGQQTRAIMRNYVRELPAVAGAQNAQMTPAELARVGAAEMVLPRYTNLLNADAASREQNDADILNTTGRQRAQTATEIDKQINPETYVAKQATLQSLLSQLDELDFNKQDINAERLVNQENIRSGNANTPSGGTTSVRNALQFGDERLKRVDALTKALGNANTFLTSSRATFDPFGRSTNATVNVPDAPRFGDIGSGIGQTSDTLLNNLFGTQNSNTALTAQRRDPLDRTNETMSSISL